MVENDEQRADLAQEEEEDCSDVAHCELYLIAPIIFDETVKVGNILALLLALIHIDVRVDHSIGCRK